MEKNILSIQIPVIGQLHRRSSFKELQYLCDGDNNGVIYFAGTSYSENQWVNPILAKETSFAGPRIEDEKNCAWWMLDIGQDHQVCF
ncbi:hypothetical protein GIB67_030780 [Kingdonia uniflora]|uniref:Uncharacterized protein n=1 Tax=Kingdonia uniflora TaxID=39325 RepID=A0A7J7L2Z7_9MAGN|nr:hypothetical protein GIB67_030780 [Kingdonia uniflora]